LVVKTAVGNQDNGKKTGQDVFIGRDKEINEIIKDMKSNKGTKILLVGESGIGKSALLDEVHRRLTKDEDLRRQTFVGYYSRKGSLIAESESLIYPFSKVSGKQRKGISATWRKNR
jgi:predicted ATPase